MVRRPVLDAAGGTFLPDHPDTRDAFADQPGASDAFQPNYLHGQIDLTADTRDHRGHPSRGGLYRAAMTTYADQGTDRFTFNQYEVDAAQFVPLAEDRWVLAFRGPTVVSDAGSAATSRSMRPSIGGSNAFARSAPIASTREHAGRQRGVAMAVYQHVDPRRSSTRVTHARASDLNLDKTSYGAGIRLHNGHTTFARLDVAQGADGWRVVARTNDPFRLSRLSMRIARIPFAP